MRFIVPRFRDPYNSDEHDKVQDVIKKTIKNKKWIVHGARAINAQLPPEYQRRTKDWDIFAKKTKQASEHLEKQLDTALGRDAFEQSSIPLTNSDQMVYRVVSKLTGEEVADFMKKPSSVKYTTVSGIRYETLEHAKKAYIRILKNPAYMQRWSKARRDLENIRAFERKLEKHDIKEKDVPEPFMMVRVRPMRW